MARKQTGDVWEDSPEERITREEVRARKGGLQSEPKQGEGEPTGVGRFLERVVIRELQKIAHERDGPELRFEHGIVVEDYGDNRFKGASASGASSVDMGRSPVFDIVCYHGDVAWTYRDNRPLACVPVTFLHGVIEVKRGVFESRLERYNNQLQHQAEYLQSIGFDGPRVFVGVQYSGNQLEVTETELNVDYLALIGDINRAGTAESMTKPVNIASDCFVGRGSLEEVVSVFADVADGTPRIS